MLVPKKAMYCNIALLALLFIVSSLTCENPGFVSTRADTSSMVDGFGFPKTRQSLTLGCLRKAASTALGET